MSPVPARLASAARSAFTSPVVLWLLIAGLVLLALAGACGKDAPQTEAEKLSPETVERFERLARDSARHFARQDSLKRAAAAADSAAALAEREADRARSAAARQRVRADSAAALARASTTGSDSARYFEAAFLAERARADSIARSDSLNRRAVGDLRAGMRAESARADEAAQREQAQADVVRRLRADIAKLERPCSVPLTFGKVPCPSRKVAFVGGVIVGTTATAVALAAVK